MIVRSVGRLIPNSRARVALGYACNSLSRALRSIIVMNRQRIEIRQACSVEPIGRAVRMVSIVVTLQRADPIRQLIAGVVPDPNCLAAFVHLPSIQEYRA